MRLHFDGTTARRLLAHSVAAAARGTTMGQLFEGACRRDGLDVDPDGDRMPGAGEADPSKVPPGLWLVGDQGVYLMSNGTPGLRGRDGAADAAVAAETRGEGAHEAKRASFGGDDGVEFLDAAMIAEALALGNAAWMCLEVGPGGIGPARPTRRDGAAP